MNQSAQSRFPIAGLSLASWVGVILFAAFVVYFYGFTGVSHFGRFTCVQWLDQVAWTEIHDYEHGWMVPLIALYMLVHAVRGMKGVKAAPSWHGLWPLLIGALIWPVAVRTMQARLVMLGLPFLLTGAVWFFWGGRVAARCAFPFFFIWLCVPLPGFQQTTVWMQLLATQAAHWGAGLCGVETLVEGTNITSASGNWDAYSVTGGCSGMRSLMALFMISIAWGYLASSLALWKRIVLGLSAIPLAVLANAFRVASIFVCAEYINPAFASSTWHDWSGLLFFFPASLVGLMLLHALLAGEIPWFKRRRVVTRQGGSAAAGAAATETSEDGKEAQR